MQTIRIRLHRLPEMLFNSYMCSLSFEFSISSIKGGDEVAAVCEAQEDRVEVHGDPVEVDGDLEEEVHVVEDREEVHAVVVDGGDGGGLVVVGDCASSFFFCNTSLLFNMDVAKCIEITSEFIHVNG
ncbi:unnamed protein product [Dovyalis caffra]|uniref:Uncharacterized protein n=1 Tax=Dovyalis caffra TaxID=77055 RepID=A0AAV1RQ76_9ROSI|nr:unnamed protein product [Dovyalis caffra]